MSYKACYSILAAMCLLGLVNCSSGHSSLQSLPPVEGITAASGTPQSHAANTAFATPLVAMVTTNGSAASGVVVTFKAPATGPSGTFADTGTNTTTAKSDSNGLATAAAFKANATAGSYMVVASVPGAPAVADFNLTNSTGAPAVMVATSGNLQSAVVSASFSTAFVVTVQDSGQNPVSNAIVVFTAPATGASGTFANTPPTTITTATTNTNGVATSGAFTANTTAGSYTVIASVGTSASVGFNLTNLAGPPQTITATSPLQPPVGPLPVAAPNTPFPAPFVVTVADQFSNPVSGAAVTFSASATPASGTFSNHQTTETDTTNASGMATSSTFTANGTTGTYTVTAALAGGQPSVAFGLANANTYVFSLSGQEVAFGGFYSLAGSVQVVGSGTVLAGEQDYNDGVGITSPQPSGDLITGGSLSVDPTTGQGTLLLNTNNPSLGVGDVETLGVQFVNTKHAQIIQFDGSATSSGSMDLQTLPKSLTQGGYAFTLSGMDPNVLPVAFGGVFSLSGTTMQNGLLDTNDAGVVTPGAALSGTLSAFDSFGRGTISNMLSYNTTGTPVPVALNYYVVGQEVIRIIGVDCAPPAAQCDSAIGSGFGQGINATNATNASLGNSIFGIADNQPGNQFGAAGMFATTPSSSPATLSGIADDDELTNGIYVPDMTISGSYSIAPNGYGSLTIPSGTLGDVSLLGIYMTDPNLNLSDPNNPSGGGGALAAEMDPILAGGIGILIPQTDTSTASFANNYSFGAQAINFGSEFDFIGQGSVTSLALSGTGLVSDPFLSFGQSTTNSGVTFSGTPLPDPSNLGRYTMLSTNTTPNPFEITINGTPSAFDVVVYQASGGQLLWLNEDSTFTTVFLGSLQQQGSLTGLPAAVKKVKPTGIKSHGVR